MQKCSFFLGGGDSIFAIILLSSRRLIIYDVQLFQWASEEHKLLLKTTHTVLALIISLLSQNY